MEVCWPWRATRPIPDFIRRSSSSEGGRHLFGQTTSRNLVFSIISICPHKTTESQQSILPFSSYRNIYSPLSTPHSPFTNHYYAFSTRQSRRVRRFIRRSFSEGGSPELVEWAEADQPLAEVHFRHLFGQTTSRNLVFSIISICPHKTTENHLIKLTFKELQARVSF